MTTRPDLTLDEVLRTALFLPADTVREIEKAADAELLASERERVAAWSTGELWHAAVSDSGQRQLYGYRITFYQQAVIDELRERGEKIDAVLAEHAAKRAAFKAGA